MRHITVLERGRIERAADVSVDAPDADLGTPHRRRLPAVLYDRLFKAEGSREDRGEAAVFLWNRNRVTVGPWVGVLQVPGLTLELLPKTDDQEVGDARAEQRVRGQLLEMLSLAGFGHVRDRGLARLEQRGGRVHEELVARFVDGLAIELVRGLDRAYLTEEDNLGVLRGRLMLARHLARNAASRHRFYCRFEALAPETAINRVLRAACDEVDLWPLTEAVARRVSEVRGLLDDVPAWPRGVAVPTIHWNRQNERFEDLYCFATMVLESRRPDVLAGATTTFSLLFQMERVFEGYIAKFAKRFVEPRIAGLRLRAQGGGDRRALFSVAGSGAKLLELRPDMLFEFTTPYSSGVTRLIVDTKWKRIDGEKKGRPSNSDLYQLYAYANRYECRKVALLYPKVADVENASFVAHGPNDGVSREVITRFVDLSMELGTPKGRQCLADRLEHIVREGLGLPPAEALEASA